MRQLLTGGRGLGAVARPGAEIGQAAEIRADRYGIRTAVRVDGIDIKFEIVLEARIELESPGPQPSLRRPACGCALDLVLCNSTRTSFADGAASESLCSAPCWVPMRSSEDAAIFGVSRRAIGQLHRANLVG